MASTMEDAASATVDGRVSNATFPVVSVWMPSAGVMACVLRAPAFATQATEVTTATKVTRQILALMQRNHNTSSSLLWRTALFQHHQAANYMDEHTDLKAGFCFDKLATPFNSIHWLKWILHTGIRKAADGQENSPHL